MGKEKALSRKIIALIVAVVIVAVAFSSFAYIEFSKKPQIELGPKLKIYNIVNPFAYAENNATETIQIFGSVPENVSTAHSYNLTGLNPYNNSYYIELFNETYSPVPNNITVFLSSNFNYIVSKWINYLIDQLGTAEISLDLIATLTTYSNTSVNGYTYYNNILFNPFNITYLTSFGKNVMNWFNNTNINPSNFSKIVFPELNLSTIIYFNLSMPTFTYNSTTPFIKNNNEISPYIIPGIKPGIHYIPVKWENLTGPLPLIGVHVNYPTAQSLLDQGAAFVSGSATLNFNSNMVVYSTSSESYKDLMSTTPSVSKTAPFYISENDGVAYPLNFAKGNATWTTAISALMNVSYYIIHYNIFEDTGTQWIYIGNATEVKISNINTVNGFDVKAFWVPIYLNDVLAHLRFSTVNVGQLAPKASLQGYNVWVKEQGYSNAANVYKKVAKAIEVFSTAINLGLALIDVYAGITAATGEFGGEVTAGEIVAKSLQLIATTISFAGTVLSDFSSISFLSSTTITGFGYSVSNWPLVSPGSTFALTDYQSVHEVSFYDSQNGQTYNFYAPMNYIIASQP